MTSPTPAKRTIKTPAAYQGKRLDPNKWTMPSGWGLCRMTGKFLPFEQLENTFPHHAFDKSVLVENGIYIEDADLLSDEGFDQIMAVLEKIGLISVYWQHYESKFERQPAAVAALAVVVENAIITAPAAELPTDKKTLRAAAKNLKVATCQVCGRAIKASTGVLAHHGYQRPGDGWQTRSCAGARSLPYELSCDALQPEIEKTTSWIAGAEIALVEFAAAPPEHLTYQRGTWRKETVKVGRPENFDPHMAESTGRNDYATLFCAEKSNRAKKISFAGVYRKHLKTRLAEWVAPTADLVAQLLAAGV